ncbi:ribonuclease III domain-containing protein [Gorgonomyces haynaldii]|nr:ribonuclease III domain-containing protein [Gorgonomyces haynaldii]
MSFQKYCFKNNKPSVDAIIHNSLADARVNAFQRLEFLGDSVLGFVICKMLHDRYLDADEGELTKRKSYLVSRPVCEQVSKMTGLEGLVKQAINKTNIYGDAMEAMIGATLQMACNIAQCCRSRIEWDASSCRGLDRTTLVH